MSISMKSILAAAVASLVVGNAMAADGTINFKGEITAAACSITGGAGTTVGGAAGNQTIDVSLGKISIDSLGGTAGGSIAGGTSLNLEPGLWQDRYRPDHRQAEVQPDVWEHY